MPSDPDDRLNGSSPGAATGRRLNGCRAAAEPLQGNDRSPDIQARRESSEDASMIKELNRALSEASPVDMDRVKRVRHAIESGTYEINSHRIADKLIEWERLLD
jgi:flagellar biosynthesis anti-sigma factor FlgM